MPAMDAGLTEQVRRDQLSRWVFWSLWATIILIAAAFYYEKAADHKSAFVRWRPQVLQFWHGVNIYDKMLFPNPPDDADLALSADDAPHRRGCDVLVRDQGRHDDRAS